MSTEQRALHQRILAAADPASVTRAERNQLYLRPTPDEEDRLCREKVGLTMPELQDKVMTSPDTLTETECNIIVKGADYDPNVPNSGKKPFWTLGLQADERQLADQVSELLANDYDNDVFFRAFNRHKALDPERKQRLAQMRQERAAAQAAQLRAARPRWLHDMFDAKLARFGFVIFRITYREGTEQKWQVFRSIYDNTKIEVYCKCWRRAGNLCSIHQPVLVSEPSLNGATVDVLRQRFKAMREQSEIPDRIATDCFLVVDDVILDHPIIASKAEYQPKAPGEPDPWQTTFSVRAVDPDYDPTEYSTSGEGDLSGFRGEISIPLPKVFDWLYYCFMAKTEDWKTRYKVTNEGPAEVMVISNPSQFIPHTFDGLGSHQGSANRTICFLGSIGSVSGISYRN
jgi:hypothetical protein